MTDFTFTFGNGSANIPEGAYYAAFVGVEDWQNAQKDYGPGCKWSWKITQGEHAGKTISCITGQKPTPVNACGKIIVALLGRTPKEGEAISLASLVGKPYLCQVIKTPNGGVKVGTVTSLP